MPLLQALTSICRDTLNRAQRGLYAGKRLVNGFTRSKSEARNKKVWKPNVQKKALYSQLLDMKLKFKVTTTALRTIDKMGGLDRYLLYTKPENIDSKLGLKVRFKLLGAFRAKHGKDFDYRDRTLIPVLGTFTGRVDSPPTVEQPPAEATTASDQVTAVSSPATDIDSQGLR